MPQPSAEHEPIMREMSDEILKVLPGADVFAWVVLDPKWHTELGRPRVYITSLHNRDGEWIGGESLDSPENRIVTRYEDRLGWAQREEGVGFAYSVREAREITDVEGSGMLDTDFAEHPGLEIFQ